MGGDGRGARRRSSRRGGCRRAGLAGVGAVLAVVAGLRRHRVLALAAVGACWRLRPAAPACDSVDGPAPAAGDVGRARTAARDHPRGRGRGRPTPGRAARAVVLLRALSVDEGGDAPARRRPRPAHGTRRTREAARGRPRPGRDDAAGAARLRQSGQLRRRRPSRAARRAGDRLGLAVPASRAAPAADGGRRDAARALARAAGTRRSRARCRRRARPFSGRWCWATRAASMSRGGDAFTRAGVVHVLSVSGLHVGLVALGELRARPLASRPQRARCCSRIDVRRVAALASLGPVALYGALAGFEVATLRSVIMTGVGVLAVLLGRRDRRAADARAGGRGGGARAAGRSARDRLPALVRVGAGDRPRRPALGTRRRRRPGARGCARRWWSSASALAGTAPLTALHFQQVSPMSLVANPLVVPLFGSVVVVLGLVGACVEPVSAAAAAGAVHARRPRAPARDRARRAALAGRRGPRSTCLRRAPSSWCCSTRLLAAAVLPRGRARRAIAARGRPRDGRRCRVVDARALGARRAPRDVPRRRTG